MGALRHAYATAGGRGMAAQAVLVALAWHADKDTALSWPSVATLALEAQTGATTARRALRALEAEGAIAAATGHARGRGRPTRYTVRTLVDNPLKAAAPAGFSPVDNPLKAAAPAGFPAVKAAAPALKAAAPAETTAAPAAEVVRSAKKDSSRARVREPVPDLPPAVDPAEMTTQMATVRAGLNRCRR